MKSFKDVKKATILLKVFSLILLFGAIGYVIYKYVTSKTIDAWCLCLIIFFTIVVAFVFFTKTFMFGNNAKRNRILLYVCVTLLCIIPSVLNIVCEFTSGRYVENSDVMAMINSGSPIVFVAILWGLLVTVLYSGICAAIAIYVEKGIVPKNEEVLEEAKAKLQIELEKQKNQNEKKK